MRTFMAICLAAALAAGCGETSPKLSADDRYVVADAEASLGRLTLNGADRAHAAETQRELLRLCDSKWAARFDERTVAEVAEEIADDLEGHAYGAWARQLRAHCSQPSSERR